MSTIPGGLRADYMRKRMEDKATINVIGGLYVGSTSSTNLDGTSNTFYVTECLPPSATVGLPLVSNGQNTIPSYQQLNTGGIAPQAVTKAKLGNGTIAAADPDHKYTLDITKDSNNVVTIHYYAE